MKPLQIFIPTAPGLQKYTLSEIEELSIKINEVSKEGLLILGHWNAVYKLNLYLKTISRIYIRLSAFNVRHFSELVDGLKSIDFSPYMTSENICIKVNSYRSRLFHEKAIKDIIQKHLSDCFSDQILTFVGSADEINTQTFLFNLTNNQLQVSVDTTGQALYKRGYQILRSEAPIRESLIASAYLSLKTKMFKKIIDPFCGSSTIPLEWMMLNQGLSNNSFRDFAFMRFKDFNQSLYQSQLTDKKELTKIEYEAYDIDEKCIHISIENFKKLGIKDKIQFACIDFLKLELDNQQDSALISNPPWGKRIDPKSLYLLYNKLQKFAQLMPVYCFLPKENIRYFKKHRIIFYAKSGSIDIFFAEILS